MKQGVQRKFIDLMLLYRDKGKTHVEEFSRERIQEVLSEMFRFEIQLKNVSIGPAFAPTICNFNQLLFDMQIAKRLAYGVIFDDLPENNRTVQNRPVNSSIEKLEEEFPAIRWGRWLGHVFE